MPKTRRTSRTSQINFPLTEQLTAEQRQEPDMEELLTRVRSLHVDARLHIPSFNPEKMRNVENWIALFESQCASRRIDTKDFLQVIPNYLLGEALNYYLETVPNRFNDYEDFKESLIQKYSLPSDSGFETFLTTIKEKDQSIESYYRKKIDAAMKANLSPSQIVEGLTMGMPTQQRTLIIASNPQDPLSWLSIAKRLESHQPSTTVTNLTPSSAGRFQRQQRMPTSAPSIPGWPPPHSHAPFSSLPQTNDDRRATPFHSGYPSPQHYQTSINLPRVPTWNTAPQEVVSGLPPSYPPSLPYRGPLGRNLGRFRPHPAQSNDFLPNGLSQTQVKEAPSRDQGGMSTSDGSLSLSDSASSIRTSNSFAFCKDLPPSGLRLTLKNSTEDSDLWSMQTTSQGGSPGSNTTRRRGQFSPDLGIESDAAAHGQDDSQRTDWSGAMAPLTSTPKSKHFPLDAKDTANLIPQQHQAGGNRTQGSKVIGWIEDYDLLKRLVDESLDQITITSAKVKELIFSTGGSSFVLNKKQQSNSLMDLDHSCQNIRVWLEKGRDLIGCFWITSSEEYCKEVVESSGIFKELSTLKDQLESEKKKNIELSNYLKVTKKEKGEMEQAISWHLTKTCKMLTEAKENLLREKIVEE